MTSWSVIPWFEARAWRIATQLIRRAPSWLTLAEDNFEGMYNLLAVVPRWAAGPGEALRHSVFYVNRDGTRVITCKGAPRELEDEARGLTLLFDSAPELYRRLAERAGLPDPRPLPRSTPETLAFQFAVAWLQLHTSLGQRHACLHGVRHDSWVRNSCFRAFPQPEMANLAAHEQVTSDRWHEEHRYWFLVDAASDEPLVCLGTDGIARTPDGGKFDIAAIRFKTGRGMWAPVARVRDHLVSLGLSSDFPLPTRTESS